MEEKEEVRWELEALEAVYGGDCHVLRRDPPLLHLRLIPRTADLTSQQFVEATIEIRAGSKYPKEPPEICLVDSKGIDSQRQNLLLNYVRLRATQLSSSSMLVAVCEEAVERLSSMNHPDGDCPLCLYPLVHEHNIGKRKSFPFMKLMSCFHCFHCECIIRWWNWLQENNNNDDNGDSSPIGVGNCPVCRMVFHAKDFEHVRHLVASSNDYDKLEFEQDAEKLLSCDSEKARREKFEAALKLQQENSGIIEPKTLVSVSPGVNLPFATAPHTYTHHR